MQKSVSPGPSHDTSAAVAASFGIVAALSFSHLLNDMMQSLLPAIYPLIKETYKLDFGQIGLLTLAFQLTASVFQPLVGMATDRRPQPYSLVAGMGLTLVGLLVLARPHIIATMRGEWFSGQTFVVIFGTVVTRSNAPTQRPRDPI